MKISERRPELFERSKHNIWLDTHIQKRMLEEHLNPKSDAASRREESFKKTIDFIESQIKQNSTILDLGCGPGLYAEALSSSGHKVTGIDFNRASIDYASQRADGINYICEDYTENFPEGCYDAVLLIYCDFGALTDSEGKLLVENVFYSLNNDGVFIFDFFNVTFAAHRKEEKNWEYAPRGGFWSENEYLLLRQTFHYPAEGAFAQQYNLIEANSSKHFIVWERYFEKAQISNLLYEAGFCEIRFFEAVCLNNNFTASDEIFVVAKKSTPADSRVKRVSP